MTAQAPEPTDPAYSISMLGYPDEETAHQHAAAVRSLVSEAAKHLDLSGLDGITLAVDYAEALRTLDRGYDTDVPLVPSVEAAVGVAMTPAVLRDGIVKSRVVVNAAYVDSLTDPGAAGESETAFVLHLLFHELCHVDITSRFDTCFPNRLLRRSEPNFHRFVQADVVRACWDEYAATRLSACVGASPAAGYEQIFLDALATVSARADLPLAAYASHGDFERLVRDCYTTYGNLCKWASYVLGDSDGRDEDVSHRVTVRAALEGHWFAPVFFALRHSLRVLFEAYPTWTDHSAFDSLAVVIDSCVAKAGVKVWNAGDERWWGTVVPDLGALAWSPACR